MGIFFTIVNKAGSLSVCTFMERQIQIGDGVKHIPTGAQLLVTKIEGDLVTCQPGNHYALVTYPASELEVNVPSHRNGNVSAGS